MDRGRCALERTPLHFTSRPRNDPADAALAGAHVRGVSYFWASLHRDVLLSAAGPRPDPSASHDASTDRAFARRSISSSRGTT